MTPGGWWRGAMVGQQYELDDLVGRGGYAEVWKARDRVHARDVAIKALLPDPQAGPVEKERDRRRFLLEAEQTSRLGAGLGIIPVYAWGTHAGRPYLVMPYEAGPTLGRLLREEGPLDPQTAVSMIGQVADAIGYVHLHDLVHRDVKPSNIMIRRVQHMLYPLVIDLGIVGLREPGGRTRLTRTGTALGSLAYMAPERLPLEFDEAVPEPEPTIDVYALGCVLHECLTGEPAFRVEDVDDNDARIYLAYAHRHRAAHRPRPGDHDPILTPFDAVVIDALKVLPQRRTASATEFKEQTQDALLTWKRLTETRTVRTPWAGTPVLQAEPQDAPSATPTPVREQVDVDDGPDLDDPVVEESVVEESATAEVPGEETAARGTAPDPAATAERTPGPVGAEPDVVGPGTEVAEPTGGEPDDPERETGSGPAWWAVTVGSGTGLVGALAWLPAELPVAGGVGLVVGAAAVGAAAGGGIGLWRRGRRP